MALNYTPSDASNAWDKGDYDAVLVNVEETTSKNSGKPMEVWTLEVYHPDGRKQTIKDYVTVPGGTFKIKQLADALGQTADFEAGTFQADANIDANLRVELKIESQEGYGDKNKVGKYKPTRATMVEKVSAAANAPRQPAQPPAGTAYPRNRGTASSGGRAPAKAPISDESELDPADIPF